MINNGYTNIMAISTQSISVNPSYASKEPYETFGDDRVRINVVSATAGVVYVDILFKK